jgi:HD-GYP domain-containing protein (c-di-GMP phosphodiesterase class II)
MVSDTIDAMTTDRPYRLALTFDKVVAELMRYRGQQFDPTIVDAVVNSVTLRRIINDKEFMAEQTSIRSANISLARPALRSQASFLDALRTARQPAE